MTLVLFVGLCLVLVPACGGGGDDSGGSPYGQPDGGDNGRDDDGDSGHDGNDRPTETGTEEDLEAAATAAFEAFLTLDDEAYFLFLSEDCREEFGFASTETALTRRRTQLTSFEGVDLRSVSIAEVQVEEFDGSSATVVLALDGAGQGEFVEAAGQPWIAEDGGWRVDDCSDFRPGQGGIEGAGSDRDNPVPFGGIADVNGWFLAVVFLQPDAEDFVMESEGNEPAAAGRQYFNATVSGSYNGAKPSVTVGDELAFAMVQGGTVYEGESCGTVFGAPDPAFTLAPGSSLSPMSICREVDSGDVDGLLLRVTHIPTGDEFWIELERND